jgi:hypothetical protein
MSSPFERTKPAASQLNGVVGGDDRLRLRSSTALLVMTTA